jgi:hypothetical protein
MIPAGLDSMINFRLFRNPSSLKGFKRSRVQGDKSSKLKAERGQRDVASLLTYRVVRRHPLKKAADRREKSGSHLNY